MKQTLAWIAGIIMLAINLQSCKTGTFASEYGKDDMAYIAITSSGQFAGKKVIVDIDKATSFTIKVQKAKQSTEKHNGNLYGIKTGKRHVVVSYNGQILYDKVIFVSSQQTKIINL